MRTIGLGDWSRNVDPLVIAEYEKDNFHPVVLVDLDWPSGRVLMNTTRSVLPYDGDDYTGIGSFGAVTLPSEGTSDIVSSEGSIVIYGDLSAVLDHSEEKVKNRRVRIYSGVTTERGGGSLIGTPFVVFDGYMNGLVVKVQRDGVDVAHALQLTMGTGPSARSVASITHSDEDQRSHYPNDTAGRHTINARKYVKIRTFPAS